MSLILDALNRSEADRTNPEAVPGLQSVHGPRDGESQAAWRRFLWPGLALLFALLALGVWLFSDSAPVAMLPQAGPVKIVPSPQAEPKPPADAAAASMPAAITEPAPEPGVKPASPQITAPAATPEPVAPALAADVAALYEQQPPAAAARPAVESPAARSEPAPDSPALDIEALTRAAQAELEDSSASREPVVEHSAPFISDLRQSLKDQIPTIFYSEHNWATQPAERSVVLNRQRYTEGQQIKPGLRLLEILPNSIVMEFQGNEFRLRSLNSWVNL